jgi:hypothetical protein
MMTEQPPAPGHGHQRALVVGRTDERLRFGACSIHPFTVRSVLTHHSWVGEYQFRAAPEHLHVAVVANGPGDADRLKRELYAAVADAGAPRVTVSIELTDRLERDPRTGKLACFVSVPA